VRQGLTGDQDIGLDRMHVRDPDASCSASSVAVLPESTCPALMSSAPLTLMLPLEPSERSRPRPGISIDDMRRVHDGLDRTDVDQPHAHDVGFGFRRVRRIGAETQTARAHVRASSTNARVAPAVSTVGLNVPMLTNETPSSTR
jgi:hypothetical protein